MDRRQALQAVGALAAGCIGNAAIAGHNDKTISYGAVAPTVKQRAHYRRMPSFAEKFRPLVGVSQRVQRDVFLWKYLERELGTVVTHDQTVPNSEGDCVGHAVAIGCDILAATEIHLFHEKETFHALASVEAIYWGSRYEIGRERIGDDWRYFSKSGGSVGEWAAEFVRTYGVLHQDEYAVGDNYIDLTGYDPQRSRARRSTGVPDWLEPIAREHPVLDIVNVKSGREALDAVVSGMPVLLCSSYRFHDTRDPDGFAAPYLGSWRTRKTWHHAMLLAGAIVQGGRIGGVILNSHGAWNKGPNPYGGPVGSFAVDLEYLDLMVRDWYDCWGLSSYIGHDALTRRHRLYLRGLL